MTTENTPAPDDAELIKLDQQIEALEVLVRHNRLGHDYQRDLEMLRSERNVLSADHHLGALAESVWDGDWFDQIPPLSKAVATRKAGAKLRESLIWAGWVDPGTHQTMIEARDTARARVVALNKFRDRVANLLDTSSHDDEHLIARLAKMRTEATEARNPGSVDQ